MCTTWLRALAAASLAIGAAACGSGDDLDVPTAAELAERLVDVDTYEGEWSVQLPDDAPEGAATGVVSDEMQDLIPGIELCEGAGAEAQAAADDLRWMAFRQLGLEVDDPIDPPDDRSGHMVFVQEFLTADEANDVHTIFRQLRDGMTACLGELPADEEGPGFAEEMALPAVGDERYGVLTTVEESSGWAEWRLHSVIVREDEVLMSIVIVDIRADAEPLYSVDDVGEMVTAAVELL